MTILCGCFAPGTAQLDQHKFFTLKDALPALVDIFSAKREWSDGPIWLAKFARGDASGEWHQPPQFLREARLAIVADARLHDRQNLLVKLGLTASDKPSDLELIAAAYRKWGGDCPGHLLGDYAFAIWDAGAKRLFCARDHIGTKPFYYASRGQEFCFAGDLRIILDAARKPFELDEEWLIQTLHNRHLVSLDRTYFDGLKALLPGHSLTLDAGAPPFVQRYWKPELQSPLILKSDDEYAEALREQVDRAVADCLDLPMAGGAAQAVDRHAQGLGMHVSGGLDSSSIAVLASRRLQQAGRPKPRAFCWQPEANSQTEASHEHVWLKTMVEQEALDLTHAQMDADDLHQLYLLDGTRIPATNTLKLERAVQREASAHNIGVILSGWGGDELVSHSGRSYYPSLLVSGQWRALVSALWEMDGSMARNLVSQAILPSLPLGWYQSIRRMRNLEMQNFVPARSLLGKHYRKGRADSRNEANPSWGVRRQMLYSINYGHLTERIESWAIHARAVGLEYRYPLLDRRVVEFALSLPASQFKRGRQGRFVFRNAMRGVLPDELLDGAIKAEPLRVANTKSVQVAVLKRLSAEIQSGKVKIRHKAFVDMDRLNAVIEGKSQEHTGAADHAIQLLAHS